MLRQLAITLSILLALQTPALGQDSTDDHAAVWASIEEIWDAQERGDETGLTLGFPLTSWAGQPPHQHPATKHRLECGLDSTQIKARDSRTSYIPYRSSFMVMWP
jgi:hypothetical protein